MSLSNLYTTIFSANHISIHVFFFFFFFKQKTAYEMVYALGQTEGILVGQSSGAAMIAALKVAQSIREGTVVTVFCDFGDKYLSTNLWIGWQKWRPDNLRLFRAKWKKK